MPREAQSAAGRRSLGSRVAAACLSSHAQYGPSTDPQHRILPQVAAHSEADDARLVVASVIGEIRHRTVRIEVTEGTEPGPFRSTVEVRDEETRKFITMGNPASTVDDALGNVHRRDARPEE